MICSFVRGGQGVEDFHLFIIWVFTARLDYSTYFESSQFLGGAKTRDPREKPLDHPQAEFGLSHM